MRMMLIGILTLMIVLAGCAQNACNPPYYEYAKGKCCVDTNANQVCDTDETADTTTTEATDCRDECTENTCIGKDFVECKEVNGCKVKAEKKKTLNQCGVECLSDDDCLAGQQCNSNYECQAGVELECKTGCTLAEITSQSFEENTLTVSIKNIGDACNIRCFDSSQVQHTSDSIKLEPGQETTIVIPNIQLQEYLSINCKETSEHKCLGTKTQIFNKVQ